MPSSDVRAAKSHAAPVTRQCLRGNHTVDARNFYSNKGWVDNGSRDVWCKDCVAKITTRDELQRYFWENHREWSAPAWDAAVRKARETLTMNKTYQSANAERKQALEDRFAVREMLGLMNKVSYYRYYDPGSETYEAAIASGRFDVVETPSDPKSKTKVYSPTFNGSFTEADLAYLTKFYNDMGGDDIDDAFDRDSVIKLAKASLAVDKAQDDYNAGRCDIQTVSNAISAQQLLAKSLNITAVQKKAKDTTHRTSWSEWSRSLVEKEIYAPKIEWPKDDIDRILEQYQHILVAVKGGEE